MSDSLHTQPRRLRAPRRVRAPFEPRRRDLGSVTVQPAVPNPRVHVSRPPAGFFHPATRADVVALLRLAGEECTYGLRAVRLAVVGCAPGERLLFGRLIVPGEVVLYAQPDPPWTLSGRIPGGEEGRLRRAGAAISLDSSGLQTIIAWPEDTLRRFMLFDVLLHELGHHVLQHERRAPAGRIVRTRDHEALADRFARRWRERLEPAMAGA
jgi:hypothetical protein